jgi:hypothetical protein
VAGSDKASIDTGADTANAGSNDWTNGDLLEIFILSRTDNASANDTYAMVLNNDGVTTNYDVELTEVANATVSSGPTLAAASWANIRSHGSGGSASYAASTQIVINDYAGTTFFKTGTLRGGKTDATAANNIVTSAILGYRSTAAITRLKITASGTGKFKVGTQIAIYKRLAS